MKKQTIKTKLTEEMLLHLNRGGVVIHDTPLYKFEIRTPNRYCFSDDQIKEIERVAYMEGAEHTYKMLTEAIKESTKDIRT